MKFETERDTFRKRQSVLAKAGDGRAGSLRQGRRARRGRAAGIIPLLLLDLGNSCGEYVRWGDDGNDLEHDQPAKPLMLGLACHVVARSILGSENLHTNNTEHFHRERVKEVIDLSISATATNPYLRRPQWPQNQIRPHCHRGETLLLEQPALFWPMPLFILWTCLRNALS